MNSNRTHKGFTLVEVLLAAGILVIGLILVAGAFPLGIKMTTVSTERTIGTIVADEAFAKIRLYSLPETYDGTGTGTWGVDTRSATTLLRTTSFNIFSEDILHQTFAAGQFEDELSWPSTDTVDDKYYHWSALLKYVKPESGYPTDVQAVVFVSRITGSGTVSPKPFGALYPNPLDLNRTDSAVPDFLEVPRPIPVPVDTSGFTTVEYITSLPLYSDGLDESDGDYDDVELKRYITEGSVLVMINAQLPNETMILNVLDIDINEMNPNNVVVNLAEKILNTRVSNYFWMIPTCVVISGPSGSSETHSRRNPCIGVFQEQIAF